MNRSSTQNSLLEAASELFRGTSTAKGSDFRSLSHRSNSSFRSLSRDGTQSFAESGFFGTSKNLSGQAAEKEYVKHRRGEGAKRQTYYDCWDEQGDGIIEKTTDVSWCLDKCCQKRSNFRSNGDEAAVHQTKGGGEKAGEAEERRFGLPEFADTGFALAQAGDDVSWLDQNVPAKLGFEFAAHRKTSIERLCLRMPKSKVPNTVSKEMVLSFAKNIKRCDHTNILKCYEVCEDAMDLYIFYENFPCVTLLSVLEAHTWTQEQVVNLVRECCAAVGYANSLGLNHLAWSLCHILLPANCLDEPRFAKVHGFGLMSILQFDIQDFVCWSPEAVESFQRVGNMFVHRLEPAQKVTCDLWSLGTVVYAAIARRAPMVGSTESVQEMILARQWGFNMTFDDFDIEAKQLIEQLMHSQPKSRIKADTALCNPWIRRRWKPPQLGMGIFDDLEEFCTRSLSKKLFGRFLVKFLDADHMQNIALAFYSLDAQGDGLVCHKDLRIASRYSERPHAAINTITAWMFREGGAVMSLERFAETMAEEVIDGKALRHSFESLDDDGSECISAAELFDELRHYSNDLTLADIKEHVAGAEADAVVEEKDDEKTEAAEEKVEKVAAPAGDHLLDFAEYMRLFPGRVARVKLMDDRIAEARVCGVDMEQQFDGVKDEVRAWIEALNSEATFINRLQKTLDQDGSSVIKDVRRRLLRVSQLLARPPGPKAQEDMAVFQSSKKKGRKGNDRAHHEHQEYGYGNFVQTHGSIASWLTLLDAEKKGLKHCIHHDTQTGQDTIDVFKAQDSCQSSVKKIEEVVEWTRFQMDEYRSIINVIMDTEVGLPSLNFSSRCLQKHGEDGDEDGDGMADGEDDEGQSFVGRLLSRLSGK